MKVNGNRVDFNRAQRKKRLGYAARRG